MRKAIASTDNGWAILGVGGMPVREIQELCFMADLMHGLALFPGSRKEVNEAVARIKRRCKEGNDFLRTIQLGVDIDESEANYMLVTHRLPRRVSMRIS